MKNKFVLMCESLCKQMRRNVFTLIICAIVFFTSAWSLSRATDEVNNEAEQAQQEAEEELQRQKEEAERKAQEAYEEAMREAEEREAERKRAEEEAYAEAQRLAEEQAQTLSASENTEASASEDEAVGAGLPDWQYASVNESRWTVNEDGTTTFKLGGKTVPFDVNEFLATVSEDELFYRCVQCEAGNQSSLGKRMVADVILNRVASPKFPNTITEVIMQNGAFEVVTRGYIFVTEPSEATKYCCDLELEGQIDYGVMYFRAGHFFEGFGVPYEQVGGHFFSKIGEDDFHQQGVAKNADDIKDNDEGEETK